jgi:hypothetical protein
VTRRAFNYSTSDSFRDRDQRDNHNRGATIDTCFDLTHIGTPPKITQTLENKQLSHRLSYIYITHCPLTMPLLQVTRPSDLCWQISFDSAPDNRLTDDMFAQLAAAMDQIEYEWRSQSQFQADCLLVYELFHADSASGPRLQSDGDSRHTPSIVDKWEGFFDKKRKGGALILTSEITKFFSNGLDFENSIKNPRFHLGESSYHILTSRGIYKRREKE